MNNFKKIIAKFAALVSAVMLLISAFSLNAFAVEKKMSGKGTKSNPYIVTTAAQFDSIRNNLKAHYKLGNTIDLGNYSNWKPIGNLKTPFSGTLASPTNSDGTPKYVLKNLKMYFDGKGCQKGDYSGYKSDHSSGWEIALFGATDGATFTNIVVLDANVESKAFGNVDMNADYSINPGMHEMATAVLIGIAQNTTITGCGASGNVTSASNYIGGLIGLLKSSKIKNSYSYVYVYSGGCWGAGGFAAAAKGTTVDSCFFSGTFRSGYTHQGAFIGDPFGVNKEESKITNCYAEGLLKSDNDGCFIGVKEHSDTVPATNVDVCSKTYTRVKMEGRERAMTNRNAKNDNYVSDEIGILEQGFAVRTQAELNQIFGAWDAWVVADGTYPQLKGVHPVNDASKYPVNAAGTVNGNTSGAGDSGNKTTSGGTTVSDNTESSGEADGTAVGGEVSNNVAIKVDVKNNTVKLNGTEKTMCIVLCVLLGLTVAASVTTVIIATVRKK